MQIPPKPWRKGKKASQRWQCHDVHQHPGRGQGEETVTREGARRRCLLLKQPSYPHLLLCPLSHANKAVCPSVPALLAGNPALPYRQPVLCSSTQHMVGSLVLLCSLISMCLCHIFLEVKKGALTLRVGRCWALGPFGCISA